MFDFTILIFKFNSTFINKKIMPAYGGKIPSPPIYLKKIHLVISGDVSLIGEVSKNCYNLIGRLFLILIYLI